MTPVEPLEASRPFMPGYGTLGPRQGTGLLPWSWAEDRLSRSRHYWLATVTPDGRPHLMAVWAVLIEGRLWFSSANGSRKARNLAANPRCSLATEDALEPVVMEGEVERVTDHRALRQLLTAENAKYGTDYGVEMVDPDHNSCWALTPTRVFALSTADFAGSPTRWSF